jgi:hypothetical protein
MLTDIQIKELAKKMNIPLERVCFKDELLEKPLKYNVSYIVNMENEFDDEGNPNDGSHWVCLQPQWTGSARIAHARRPEAFHSAFPNRQICSLPRPEHGPHRARRETESGPKTGLESKA